MAPIVHQVSIDPKGDAILVLQNPKPKDVRGAYEVHYKVSAAVLCEYSDVWKTMFQDLKPSGDGLLHVTADGFHTEGMRNVLKIMHGDTKAIEQLRPVDDIIRIARIVEFYGIQGKHTSTFANLWFKRQRLQADWFPHYWNKWLDIKTTEQDHAKLLYVSLAFRFRKNFNQTLALQIRYSHDPLKEHGLLTTKFVEKVNSYCQKLIEDTESSYTELKKKLEEKLEENWYSHALVDIIKAIEELLTVSQRYPSGYSIYPELSNWISEIHKMVTGQLRIFSPPGTQFERDLQKFLLDQVCGRQPEIELSLEDFLPPKVEGRTQQPAAIIE